MSQRTFKIHPAAQVFPVMGDAELDELAADIKTNGQLDPVVLHPEDDSVLDGRSRIEACRRAGVEPDTCYWDGEGSPVTWVLSKNLHRRHLTASQKAVVAADALPLFETEAKERQRASGGAKAGAVSAIVREPVEAAGKASHKAAKVTGVSARYVEAAKAIAQRDPKLLEQVRAGKVTLNQAKKAIKRGDQLKQIAEYVPPKGRYGVIVADPPWPYEDQLSGSDAARGGTPYPAMTLGELGSLKVPADDSCVLWLWCTNAHLIDGSAAWVLDGWGFKGKTMLTWVKPKMGVGRWLRGQTEHCILATRGKPVVTLTNQTTVLTAPLGEHSEKPDAFYELVEKLCPATSRLELFARKPREGWVTSGAELPEAKTFTRSTRKRAAP